MTAELILAVTLLLAYYGKLWAADRADQRARQAAAEAAQRSHEKKLAGVK